MNAPITPPAGDSPATRLSRRTFLRSASTVAAAGTLARQTAFAQGKSDDLNIAIIGCGAQGNVLMNAALNAQQNFNAGIRFVAVCDIWEVNRGRMAGILTKRGFPVKEYTDVEEMLKAQPEIDACLIASPDFLHAPHTIVCLEAGKAVYCEKMMSNTIEGAKSMVDAQKRTGKLCQIGHQRRSNPRYLRFRNDIFHGNKLLGQVTHGFAQWNRGVSASKLIEFGDKSKFLDQATLSRYGFESMEHFLNWRWFKKYGGGALSDLGAHQIDLFAWMFDSLPISVIAGGGIDYYDGSACPDGTLKPRYEYPDNIIAIYEFNVGGKTSRGIYQVLTTSSSQGFYEKWMGTEGSVTLSELPSYNQIYREPNAPDWSQWVSRKLLRPTPEGIHHKFWEAPRPWHRPDKWLYTEGVIDARASKPLESYDLAETLAKPAHQPHLENFFQTVKKGGGQKDLNCPVEEAYKTCVAVLTAYQAVADAKKITFDPAMFTV